MGKKAVTVESIPELIEASADAGAIKAIEMAGGAVDHYRAMEKLLYNYKKTLALVSDEEAYLNAEHHTKSKSVTVFSANGGSSVYKADDEVVEEIAKMRLLDYERTATQFQRLQRVIEQFKEDKEFIVIRMYYFGEDAQGNERERGAKRCTLDDIAFELSVDASTVGRWRKRIVSDMAVVRFQGGAALSTSRNRTQTAQ